MGTFSDLDELTAPAAGDFLVAVDVSEAANKDKILSLSKMGVLSLAQSWTANQIFGGGVNSQTIALNDDQAAAVTPSTSNGGVWIAANNRNTCGMIGQFRSTGSRYLVAYAALADTVITTGALIGTTGADGKVTISMHTDGLIYIENRMGATLSFYFLFMGP